MYGFILQHVESYIHHYLRWLTSLKYPSKNIIRLFTKLELAVVMLHQLAIFGLTRRSIRIVIVISYIQPLLLFQCNIGLSPVQARTAPRVATSLSSILEFVLASRTRFSLSYRVVILCHHRSPRKNVYDSRWFCNYFHSRYHLEISSVRESHVQQGIVGFYVSRKI